ncbi:MAG: hypothetical protein HY746_06765 [Elusimicrobia bacterium]|nr:hypothetical protein [Elusimicrobiota bacterium]
MKKHEFKIGVNIFKEGKNHVVYSPALDLSSCGRTEVKAKRNFEKALKLFLEELEDMGTLEDVLLELGWRRADTPKYAWIPPHLLNAKVRVHLPKSV